MGKEYCLKDYTASLPSRTDLCFLSKKFRWLNSNGNGSRWNVPHHWMVDYFFLNSPMKEHYEAYLQATSEHSHKIFKGQLLNQLVLTYLVFLEHPQQSSYAGIAPIMKTFGTWKNTFMRRYNGLLNKGKHSLEKMKSLSPIDNKMKKYRYKPKFAIIYANRIHDRVYRRATEIQSKFKAHVIEGKKLGLKSWYEEPLLPWKVEVDEKKLVHEW